jgi:hypothetical protein
VPTGGAVAARTIEWGFLSEKFGGIYKDGAQRVPLPTRLMAGSPFLLTIAMHPDQLGIEVRPSRAAMPLLHDFSDCVILG